MLKHLLIPLKQMFKRFVKWGCFFFENDFSFSFLFLCEGVVFCSRFNFSRILLFISRSSHIESGYQTGD
jgi:hypothetical protein